MRIAPIYLHEIVSGAVNEVVVRFAEYTDVRCEPVFQAGTRVAEHVTVAVSSVSKLETICDETAEPTRSGVTEALCSPSASPARRAL